MHLIVEQSVSWIRSDVQWQGVPKPSYFGRWVPDSLAGQGSRVANLDDHHGGGRRNARETGRDFINCE